MGRVNLPATWHAVALRALVFIVLFILVLFGSAPVLGGLFGPLVAATVSILLATATSSWITLRIYENRSLPDLGLHWNRGAQHNLGWGLAGGVGAALVVLLPPLVLQLAYWEPDRLYPATATGAPFVLLLLVAGAAGEELLFRGYLFQLLIRQIGAYATILPFAMLFGLAHLSNQNGSALGVANTVGWGVLLGFAFLRSGDLWLPIGLHYGWNATLPLLGVNLSGFTIGVTGMRMQWRVGELWSGGAYGPEAGLLTTAVLPLLFWYLRRAPIRRQAAPLLPDLGEE